MRLRAAVAAALFATFAGLIAAAPASASVRYSFMTEAGSFTVVSDEFITLHTEMAPADLESCAPMEDCPGSKFMPEDARDKIEFSPDGEETVYQFEHHAFTTPGRHDTLRDSPKGILIVTIVDDDAAMSVAEIAMQEADREAGGQNQSASSEPSAVPEPGTWLMMLSGFGLLGLAMRRRRRARAKDPQPL